MYAPGANSDIIMSARPMYGDVDIGVLRPVPGDPESIMSAKTVQNGMIDQTVPTNVEFSGLDYASFAAQRTALRAVLEGHRSRAGLLRHKGIFPTCHPSIAPTIFLEELASVTLSLNILKSRLSTRSGDLGLEYLDRNIPIPRLLWYYKLLYASKSHVGVVGAKARFERYEVDCAKAVNSTVLKRLRSNKLNDLQAQRLVLLYTTFIDQGMISPKDAIHFCISGIESLNDRPDVVKSFWIGLVSKLARYITKSRDLSVIVLELLQQINSLEIVCNLVDVLADIKQYLEFGFYTSHHFIVSAQLLSKAYIIRLLDRNDFIAHIEVERLNASDITLLCHSVLDWSLQRERPDSFHIVCKVFNDVSKRTQLFNTLFLQGFLFCYEGSQIERVVRLYRELERAGFFVYEDYIKQLITTAMLEPFSKYDEDTQKFHRFFLTNIPAHVLPPVPQRLRNSYIYGKYRGEDLLIRDTLLKITFLYFDFVSADQFSKACASVLGTRIIERVCKISLESTRTDLITFSDFEGKFIESWDFYRILVEAPFFHVQPCLDLLHKLCRALIDCTAVWGGSPGIMQVFNLTISVLEYFGMYHSLFDLLHCYLTRDTPALSFLRPYIVSTLKRNWDNFSPRVCSEFKMDTASIEDITSPFDGGLTLVEYPSGNADSLWMNQIPTPEKAMALANALCANPEDLHASLHCAFAVEPSNELLVFMSCLGVQASILISAFLSSIQNSDSQTERMFLWAVKLVSFGLISVNSLLEHVCLTLLSKQVDCYNLITLLLNPTSGASTPTYKAAMDTCSLPLLFQTVMTLQLNFSGKSVDLSTLISRCRSIPEGFQMICDNLPEDAALPYLVANHPQNADLLDILKSSTEYSVEIDSTLISYMITHNRIGVTLEEFSELLLFESDLDRGVRLQMINHLRVNSAAASVLSTALISKAQREFDDIKAYIENINDASLNSPHSLSGLFAQYMCTDSAPECVNMAELNAALFEKGFVSTSNPPIQESFIELLANQVRELEVLLTRRDGMQPFVELTDVSRKSPLILSQVQVITLDRLTAILAIIPEVKPSTALNRANLRSLVYMSYGEIENILISVFGLLSTPALQLRWVDEASKEPFQELIEILDIFARILRVANPKKFKDAIWLPYSNFFDRTDPLPHFKARVAAVLPTVPASIPTSVEVSLSPLRLGLPCVRSSTHLKFNEVLDPWTLIEGLPGNPLAQHFLEDSEYVARQ